MDVCICAQVLLLSQKKKKEDKLLSRGTFLLNFTDESVSACMSGEKGKTSAKKKGENTHKKKKTKKEERRVLIELEY